jgi:hypothetical protein
MNVKRGVKHMLMGLRFALQCPLMKGGELVVAQVDPGGGMEIAVLGGVGVVGFLAFALSIGHDVPWRDCFGVDGVRLVFGGESPTAEVNSVCEGGSVYDALSVETRFARTFGVE